MAMRLHEIIELNPRSYLTILSKPTGAAIFVGRFVARQQFRVYQSD